MQKGAGSKQAALTMAYKLLDQAQQSWRAFNGAELVKAVLDGVAFKDGERITDDKPRRQGRRSPPDLHARHPQHLTIAPAVTRIAVLAVPFVLVALLTVLAIASDLLMAARQPWVDPGRTLVDMDAHGGLLVLRGAVAFLMAALVGAVVGRTLPSVIVATALVAVVGAAGLALSNLWLEANVEYRAEPVNAVSLPGGVYLGTMSRAKDGIVIPDDVALSLAPRDVDPAAWVAENYENVYAVVPGSAYPRYVYLETAVLAVVLVVQVASILATVQRRRPV